MSARLTITALYQLFLGEKAADAAAAMGITAERLKELGLVDTLIPEPLGGAQRSPQETAERLKQQLVEQLAKLDERTPEQLLETRYQRLMSFGIQ